MNQLYAGILADDRFRLPPGLVLELWRGECSRCGVAVAWHRPALARNRRRCKARGDSLAIVCPSCADRALAEHGGIEFMEITPEVARHFNRG